MPSVLATTSGCLTATISLPDTQAEWSMTPQRVLTARVHIQLDNSAIVVAIPDGSHTRYRCAHVQFPPTTSRANALTGGPIRAGIVIDQVNDRVPTAVSLGLDRLEPRREVTAG